MSLCFAFKGTLTYDTPETLAKVVQESKEFLDDIKEDKPDLWEIVHFYWEDSFQTNGLEITIDIDTSTPGDAYLLIELLVEIYLENAIAGSLAYVLEGGAPTELLAGSGI